MASTILRKAAHNLPPISGKILENFKTLFDGNYSYGFVTLQNLLPAYSFFGFRTDIRFSIVMKIKDSANKRIKNMCHYNMES